MSYVWTAVGSRVRKTKSLTEMGNPVISASLGTTARCESKLTVEAQMNGYKMGYMDMMEYFSTIKR